MRDPRYVLARAVLLDALDALGDQDDSVDLSAHLVQPLGLFEVRAIQIGVVLQLARSLDAVVERLAVTLRRVGLSVPPARLQQIPPLARQGHHRVVPIDADGLDEPGLPKMPQFAVARVERLVERVAQIVGRDDAEGADAAQRTALGAAQRVVVAVVVDVLALVPSRQVHVLHEHVPRVRPVPLARV